MNSDFADEIKVVGCSALVRRKSFSETLKVSDEERRAERSAIRKAAGPGAAERVSLRFAKVVQVFKEAEGRSPEEEDYEVWKALAEIVRQESGQ